MSRKHKPTPEQNQPSAAAKTDAPELVNKKPKAQYRIRTCSEPGTLPEKYRLSHGKARLLNVLLQHVLLAPVHLLPG